MREAGVVGLGETGRPLYDLLVAAYPDTGGYDVAQASDWTPNQGCRVLHVCLPWSEQFHASASTYYFQANPELVIIHSTVPVGTTRKIPFAVHSPILGDHTNMRDSLVKFEKWVGGERAAEAAGHMEQAGLRCRVVATSDETELMKLMCLAKYGMSIAFAQYQKDLCDQHGVDYADVVAWDQNYNRHVATDKQRPVLSPPGSRIGGHCVMPGTRLLYAQHPSPLLQEVLRYQERSDTFTAWHPCNIYPSAQIGKDVSVGMFTEIGPNVIIGDRTRIGAGCFIPEGVTIEEDCFIGPNSLFANDKWPPSGRDQWDKTLVRKGARIGAGCCILPGVTIGKNSLLGMGSTLTKNLPDEEVWYGNPAKPQK